jgi:hypothetical protein
MAEYPRSLRRERFAFGIMLASLAMALPASSLISRHSRAIVFLDG